METVFRRGRSDRAKLKPSLSCRAKAHRKERVFQWAEVGRFAGWDVT